MALWHCIHLRVYPIWHWSINECNTSARMKVCSASRGLVSHIDGGVNCTCGEHDSTVFFHLVVFIRVHCKHGPQHFISPVLFISLAFNSCLKVRSKNTRIHGQNPDRSLTSVSHRIFYFFWFCFCLPLCDLQTLWNQTSPVIMSAKRIQDDLHEHFYMMNTTRTWWFLRIWPVLPLWVASSTWCTGAAVLLEGVATVTATAMGAPSVGTRVLAQLTRSRGLLLLHRVGSLFCCTHGKSLFGEFTVKNWKKYSNKWGWMIGRSWNETSHQVACGI